MFKQKDFETSIRLVGLVALGVVIALGQVSKWLAVTAAVSYGVWSWRAGRTLKSHAPNRPQRGAKSDVTSQALLVFGFLVALVWSLVGVWLLLWVTPLSSWLRSGEAWRIALGLGAIVLVLVVVVGGSAVAASRSIGRRLDSSA